MIVLAIYQLSTNEQKPQPKIADFAQVPNLFGVCVYSFMCHHSLPSMITPIRDKKRVSLLLRVDYLLILGFYILLSLTAVFAFTHIPDLYTLTFEPSKCPNPDNPAPAFFQYFLALFPVFTLSTSFPIIGITLRNNLQTLFLTDGKIYPFLIRRVLFPLLVLLPPVAVALATNQVDILVGITGSYAGSAIQYFIPVALVYCGRKEVQKRFGSVNNYSHTSPFKHVAWLIGLIIWAVACVVFVTVKHVTTGQ